MKVNESESAQDPIGNSPRKPRRRVFTTAPKVVGTKGGRDLLLQDSDDEEVIKSPRRCLQSQEPELRESATFQDIMARLEEEHDRASLPEISLSRVNSQGESDRGLRRNSRHGRQMSNSRSRSSILPQLPESHMATEDDPHGRRHSIASTVSTRHSHRHSSEAAMRSPALTGSFVSLSDTAILELDDLEMLRTLKRRQAILRELVMTEVSFSEDLAVVIQEYQQKADTCEALNPDDARQIFGGVEPVMSFSCDFAADLQVAASTVLMSDATALPILHYEDTQTSVGAVFGQFMGRLSKVFSRYCSTHEKAAACLQKATKEPAIQTWLESRHPVDRTTAWDLPSLLIKPVQRVLKYPLLLASLLEATSKSHPDYIAIDLALKEMLFTAENINNIKKRRDLVGTIIADRKKTDLSGLAKTFQRRTSKLKQTINLEDDYETSDILYDGLALRIKTQQAVLHTLRSEVQDWLLAMRAALEYHASVSSALLEMKELDESREAVYKSSVEWSSYATAVSDLQQGALVELSHNLEREVFQPISSLEAAYLNPALVMAKRDRRLDDFHRVRIIRLRGGAVDKVSQESASNFTQLNKSLIHELPTFLGYTKQAMDLITANLALIQAGWYRSWSVRFEHLLADNSAPTDILEHFKDRQTVLQVHLSELSLTNGSLTASNKLDNDVSRVSEDSSSISDNSSLKVNTGAPRPSMRVRALSAANNASISLKQISMRTVSSGSTTPTLRSPRHSYQ